MKTWKANQQLTYFVHLEGLNSEGEILYSRGYKSISGYDA